MDETEGRDLSAETNAAGEGTWDQGSGQVQPDAGDTDPDAGDDDEADQSYADPDAGDELIADGVQPYEKGHGDGEIEERPDQVGGHAGVQRQREDIAVYDPHAEGRVGLGGAEDLDVNPSDPASYPDPMGQVRGTSRVEPELADGELTGEPAHEVYGGGVTGDAAEDADTL